MRNFLNTALEGHQDPTFANLSLEEEQDLLVEATTDEAAVNADMAQVERISDMSDALEDLAVVTDGMGEDGPSDTEAALVDTMANMAVAGTDVEATEIVPAMESFGGRKLRYSSESIRDRAKAIWESIRKFLKQIWDKITSFFYKIFGTIPALRRRLEALKKSIDDNSRRVIEDKKITISTSVSALSVDYKQPKNGEELKKNFTTFVNEAKDIYTAVADSGLKLGEIVLKGLEDFDGDKPAESLRGFRREFMGQFKNIKPGTTGSDLSGKRFGDELKVMGSAPLMGNITIIAKIPKEVGGKDGDAPTVRVLEMIRKVGFEVIQTSEKPKDSPASFEMETCSNGTMSSLVEEALDLLDVLEKFQRGKRASEMKSLRGKMETASDRLSKDMDKLAGSDEKAERDAVPYYRAMVNFNSAYARWMKDPAMPMVSHSLASIRGVMNVCQKSISAYK